MIDFMVLRTPFRTLRLSLRRLLRGIRVRVVPKAAGVDASVLGCLSVLDSEVSDMAGAVRSLDKYFNMSGNSRNDMLNSSADTSRSGSFCSDVDTNSLPSSSPPPADNDRFMRLPLFNRLA